MLRFHFYTRSFLDVDPDAIRLGANAFERWLPRLLPRLVSEADFRGFWKADDEGAPTCCPLVLCGMLLLQFRFDVSDRVLVERCRRDLGWKHALGLAVDQEPPSVSSVVRFRAKLRERHGADWLFRRALTLAKADGHMVDTALQAADSTNTDCRGAVIDTFNLIAVAIGQVIRRISRHLGECPTERARVWNLSHYLERSIKGQACINWSDETARNQLLTEEIRDADEVARLAHALDVTLPSEVAEALELLRVVARQDVELLPDGTYKIAKGTTPGRVISITDPEARHGRKSSAKAIQGYKTHVLGTLDSQFVTGIQVTDASVHDAKPTPALLEQAKSSSLAPQEMVADGAYGTGANRRACAAMGVTVHAKLPAPSHVGSFPKSAFTIDLERQRVTCPAGVVTERRTLVKDPAESGAQVAKFHFNTADCQGCSHKALCCSKTAKGYNRTIILSVYEAELQAAKAFALSAEATPTFQKRAGVERLISHLVRFGMRQARFFGMFRTQFQAAMVAATYNLQRYMTLEAKRERLQRWGVAAA
jgi:hypothetical protein